MVADVSSENDCRGLIELTNKIYGGIDVLINNAGISMRAELKDASVDVIKKVMEINFFGAVYCTKYALPFLIERKGTVVGVSSIAGYRGLRAEAATLLKTCFAGLDGSDQDRVA
jgi:Short-chain dehydrogenases of various substrate specificities